MLAFSVRVAAGVALVCLASGAAVANVISDGVYHASPNAAAIESVMAGPHDLGIWHFVQTFAGDNSPYGGAVVFDPANPPEVQVSVLNCARAKHLDSPALGTFVVGLGNGRSRSLA